MSAIRGLKLASKLGQPSSMLPPRHIDFNLPWCELRVEDLAVGDLVATATGVSLPIKWIGRQHFKQRGVKMG